MDRILTLLSPVIAQLVELVLTREVFAAYGDRLFDLLEDVVRDSRTPLDDALVLPLLASVRTALLPQEPKA